MCAVLFGTGVFLFSVPNRLLFSRFRMAAWQLPDSGFFCYQVEKEQS